MDDESGVDGQIIAGRVGDVLGVRVAAEPRVRFVERDVVAATQEVCGGQAGNAGADHGQPPTLIPVGLHGDTFRLRPPRAGTASDP